MLLARQLDCLANTKGDKMKVQKSIEIAASPNKIWAFFVEPEKVL